MRKILSSLFVAVFAAFFIAGSANAAEKLRYWSDVVDLFVLQNTTGGAFDNYQIYVVHGADHKIAYRTGPIAPRVFGDYCNVTDQQDDCQITYDPGPVYLEWELAQQINVEPLTPANKRLYLLYFVWEHHISRELRKVENWLNNVSGYTNPNKKRAYGAAMQAWGVDPLNTATCEDKVFPGGQTCNVEDTGMTHVTGRVKRITEDLDSIIVELP